MGLLPLGRCHAARASMVFRADCDALLNDVRDEPNQTPLQRRKRDQAEAHVAEYPDSNVSERDLVEARIVLDALEELGVDEKRAEP